MLKISEMSIPEVKIIHPDIHRDHRGYFMETWHEDKYRTVGISEKFVQANLSHSSHGVLRGIHYQDQTAPMAKLIRCTRGIIYDVAIDLRSRSKTYGMWCASELDGGTGVQLFIPAGFGHAFMILSDSAEVEYLCSSLYTPEAEHTISWDDPTLAISWPLDNPILSDKDRGGMSFEEYRKQPSF